ncbi:hypothetical protein AOLI_G00230660 [Acnodon oligacanthus]
MINKETLLLSGETDPDRAPRGVSVCTKRRRRCPRAAVHSCSDEKPQLGFYSELWNGSAHDHEPEKCQSETGRGRKTVTFTERSVRSLQQLQPGLRRKPLKPLKSHFGVNTSDSLFWNDVQKFRLSDVVNLISLLCLYVLRYEPLALRDVAANLHRHVSFGKTEFFIRARRTCVSAQSGDEESSRPASEKPAPISFACTAARREEVVLIKSDQQLLAFLCSSVAAGGISALSFSWMLLSALLEAPPVSRADAVLLKTDGRLKGHLSFEMIVYPLGVYSESESALSLEC